MLRAYYVPLILALGAQAFPSFEREEAPSLPYQASLQFLGGYHYCGGSILDNDTLLTAAHCCHTFNPSDIQVLVGEADLVHLGEEAQIALVKEMSVHELYGTHGMNYDACVVKLLEPLQLNEKVGPVALPEPNAEFTGHALLSGWGSISDEDKPVLASKSVEIISPEDCYKVYGEKLDGTMLCARGSDACQGDAGGPLVQEGTLVGSVSWGYGCTDLSYPGVYGKVSEYVDWIEKHMQ